VARRLPQLSGPEVGLGQPTVMDRTLAAQYGVAYVHLMAFSIDVDRVYAEAPAEGLLPFGWEVFLCARYLQARVDSRSDRGRSLIEDSVLQILAAPPGEPRLGGVLAFAVYAGVERGLLDQGLKHAFSTWRSPSKQLRRALDGCFADGDLLPRVALHCLGTAMAPPLSPPSLASLQEMASGNWTPSGV